jgi:hypothetical protein
MMRLAMRSVPGPVLAALVLLAVTLRLGVAANGAIDPDESQHLHVAWRIGQGEVPYRDFWEHHLPALHYGLAPLTRWRPDDPAVYFAARAAMLLLAAGAALLTGWLARGVSPGTAAWATIVLGFLPQFAETSTEVRPDVPALVAQLGAIAALVRWRRGHGGHWLGAAGLAQGGAVALSLKAVAGAAGLGLAVLLPREPPGRPGPRWGPVVGFFAAVAVAPAALLAALCWQGGGAALGGLHRDVIRGSLAFADHAKSWPVFGSELGAFLAAGLGLALLARREGAGLLRHPVHGALLIPLAVTGAVMAWPWTPAVYQHAWLPLLPGVALYAGRGLAEIAAWARAWRAGSRRAVVAAAVTVAVALPAADTLRSALRDRNAAQLGLMAELLRQTCPGEPVLDGTALAVFRPAAHRFGVLITGVREWVARGVLAEETLEADMRAARPRIAYVDQRVRGMVGPVAAFLRRHYVPAWSGLLVAGARIATPADADGGRAYVDLVVEGAFLLTIPPGLRVEVDGAPVRPGWVTLAAGRHEVTWRGAGGTIGLRAATCPERRALGEGGGPAPARARALTASTAGG